MIKFTANLENNRTLIGIGLSASNLERLLKGQPIRFDLKEMNVGIDGEVLIFFGETEADMEEWLRPYIDDRTKLHIDPKLKS